MRQEAARLACDVRSIKLIIPMSNSNKAIAYQINDQGRTIMKPIARHIEVFAELPGVRSQAYAAVGCLEKFGEADDRSTKILQDVTA